MTISRCDDRVIRIVAAVVADAEGRTLLVRKRGTEAFMLPGGKPGPDEAPLAALDREIGEELGCGLNLESCRALGRFEAPAANERGYMVEAQLFAATLVGHAEVSGEIEELAWVDPDGDLPMVLAPLARTHALPIARGWKQRLRAS
jgi:8-oxo-dGTP diphosphatase